MEMILNISNDFELGKPAKVVVQQGGGGDMRRRTVDNWSGVPRQRRQLKSQWFVWFTTEFH
jgi:hypothetical protein